MASGERSDTTRSSARNQGPGEPDPIRSFFAGLAARYTLERQRHTVDKPGATAAGHSHGDALIDELVRSMLQWEAGHAQARAAYQRLLASVTDYNELRICFPRELAEVLGPRYPRLEERCERLCAALNDIAAREQALTLEPLARLDKRKARKHVESIQGLPRFAVARVMLFGFRAHAFPLDERLLSGLVGAGLFQPAVGVDAAASKIERSVRAGHAADPYDHLEMWSPDTDADHERAGDATRPAMTKPTTDGPPPPKASG